MNGKEYGADFLYGGDDRMSASKKFSKEELVRVSGVIRLICECFGANNVSLPDGVKAMFHCILACFEEEGARKRLRGLIDEFYEFADERWKEESCE